MLPPKVREKHGSYFYVHQKRWHKLSRVEQGTTALYTALQAWTSDRPATYGQLMMLYIARALPELKEATRPEYLRIINSRLQHHFGHMVLNSLDSPGVAQYLELRKKEGAPVGGNRERAVLCAVISWGMRYGWCSFNPGYGVRRNKELPSKRYVTTAELQAVLDRAPDALADLLAAAYLTGFRQGDLRIMQKSAITAKGLSIVQSKDGKAQEMAWSPLLREVIRRAVARSDNDFVFVSANGNPYTMDGLQCALKRLKPGFSFRDLRPKAATDAGHNILGHDVHMLTRYTRARANKPTH